MWTDDHLWNGYLRELLMPGNNRSDTAQTKFSDWAFLVCLMHPQGHIKLYWQLTFWNKVLQNNFSDVELLRSDVFSNYHLQNLMGVKKKSSLWTVPDPIFIGTSTAFDNTL